MKKAVFIGCFLLVSLMSFAQISNDIIVTKDQEQIQCTITEVKDSIVKYNKIDRPSSLVYNISVKRISKILYKNGAVEDYENPELSTHPVVDTKSPEELQSEKIATLEENVESENPHANRESSATNTTVPSHAARTVVSRRTVGTQKSCFIGGTGQICYAGAFSLTLIPQLGYEFNDRFAVGAGIGVRVITDAYVNGIFEPFMRVTAWHNDLFYLDFKGVARLFWGSSIETLQVGLRPSLRFRINDHWDLSADIGLLGVQYSGDWGINVGITGTDVGIWGSYRF